MPNQEPTIYWENTIRFLPRRKNLFLSLLSCYGPAGNNSIFAPGYVGFASTGSKTLFSVLVEKPVAQ